MLLKSLGEFYEDSGSMESRGGFASSLQAKADLYLKLKLEVFD